MSDISKKCIKYKTKYYRLIIEKLQKSLNPSQGSDFYFLTIPEGHPDAGRDVPIDYKLKNLVLYFWKNGYITQGLDQGYQDANIVSPAFIIFTRQDISGNDTVTRLAKLFKKKFGNNRIVINNRSISKGLTNEEIIKGIKEGIQWQDNFLKNNPNKILINVTSHNVEINFKSDMILEIHKKLKLKIPLKENSYPGGLVLYDPRTDSFNVNDKLLEFMINFNCKKY